MTGVADRPPHHLSVGQRRRVAVATVLAMRPSILVLDEPSANLDPAARAELADVLERSTSPRDGHPRPALRAAALRPRLVMHEGRIVADGPVDAILDDADLLAANRLALPFGYRAMRSRIGAGLDVVPLGRRHCAHGRLAYRLGS